MGASWRHYPTSETRKKIIEQISTVLEADRTGDDWWQLGEYQILEGLTGGEEALVNAGTAALMKGASLSPPHAGCLLDLGWILCFKGLDQMALSYLDLAAEEVPRSRDVWSIRGWACIGAGNRQMAIDSFRRAIMLPEATEGDRSTLHALECGKDLYQLRKDVVLRKFDDELIMSHNEYAKDYARSGILQFRQLLEKNPADRRLAYALAHCYYILDRFDHAEALLLRVVGDDAGDADALTLLGLISMKRGNREAQKEYYEKAVTADPSHVLANTNLASLYQDLGDFHRARPLLVRAIEAAPSNDPHLSIALDLLGNSYGTIEHDYATEAELHRRAIALEPRRELFHANLVVALVSAGRAKDAHRALQEAKSDGLTLPNESFLSNLVKLYQERTLHPYEYMQMIDKLAPMLGWPALRPLVRRAWDRRKAVSPEEQQEFLEGLGLMASRTGDGDLGLEIWRLGAGLPDGQSFTVNVAAELSMMGRHEDALDSAESMSMDTPRSWTVLGNIRQAAGLHHLAIEAYRTALDRDERFLLPLANALNSAREGGLPEELAPFIQRLEDEWQSLPVASSLRGQALALQGRLTSAADCFEQALWCDEGLRTPEDFWKEEGKQQDPTLIGEPSMEHHYAAACCFLALGHLDRLLEMIARVREWPKWMNGDWKILESEVYLAGGDLDRASAVVDGMADQPPPRLVAAKIALARGDEHLADQLIGAGLADEHATQFNHPLGRPDALFRALASQRALARGDLEEAESLAREAVQRDPSSADARMALVRCLAGRGSEREIQELLRDGLKRTPGHAGLISAFVETLVEAGKGGEAGSVLESNRALLLERGDELVAYRLGEFLAVDRLSRIVAHEPNSTAVDEQWQWVEDIPSPMGEWFRGAYLALQRSEELAAAYGLYVSKVAEYILRERVMIPFRESCLDPTSMTSGQHRDISRFMKGGFPPSIGAVAKLFESARLTIRPVEDGLVTRFREKIALGSFGDPNILLGAEFVSQLADLGRVRNSIAHVGEASLSEIRSAARCVLDDVRPGLLLTVFEVARPR